MNSVINEENALAGGEFFQFKNVGDQIEGTLIAKRDSVSRLTGKPQIIYRLKTDRGIFNIGGKPGIDMQMQNVKLGQIVGFKFTGTKPPKSAGMNPAKLIQVYANPRFVDKEWLEAEEENAEFLKEAEDMVDGKVVDNEKNGAVEELVSQTKGVPFVDKAEVTKMFDCIMQMAKDKFLAKDNEDAKQKVMEATGLFFMENNYLTIIEKLSELPNKVA